MSRFVFVDFETFYAKDYSISDFGNYGYCHHKLFDPYMVSVVADDGEEWVGDPREFPWEALEGENLLSHNAAFDSAVYQGMVDLGIAPRVAFKSWQCTANMTSCVLQRRSLKDAVEVGLRLKVDKSARADAKGKRWPDMVRDGSSDRMLQYALDDSRLGMQLWKKFNHRWSSFEQRLSLLTLKSTATGCHFDKELLKKYTDACEEQLFEIKKGLPWIEEGKSPTSTKAIADHCRRNGIPCPPTKADDAEGFDAWVEMFQGRFPWVSLVGEFRVANKALQTLYTIKTRARPDGTVETPLKYFGAPHTGRWSGDSGLNFQNFRKKPLKCAGIEVDVRRLWIAPPGCEFAISDLAQIEPRVEHWLAGDTAFLKLVGEGFAVYEAFARSNKSPGFAWSGKASLKETDPDRYALCKAAVLGLGYQCGSDGFVTAAQALAGVTVTKEESVEIVKSYRESKPKIVQLWKTLDEAFKGSADQNKVASGENHFEIDLPSGRTIRYEDVRSSLRRVSVYDEEKKRDVPVIKRVFTANIGGVRRAFYGGKLAENATQATAREVFAEKLLELDAKGFSIPFHVHDEVLAVIPEGSKEAAEEVGRIMGSPVEWLPGCPLGASVEVSKFYKK